MSNTVDDMLRKISPSRNTVRHCKFKEAVLDFKLNVLHACPLISCRDHKLRGMFGVLYALEACLGLRSYRGNGCNLNLTLIINHKSTVCQKREGPSNVLSGFSV